MDSAQYQTDPNLMTFRYTLPSEIQYHNSHNHLCEHHRKKLSDLFLLDHLAKKYNIKTWNKKNLDNKNESDGNVSDDEDDTGEYGKIKPADEIIKKHVVHTRSESGSLIKRIEQNNRIKTTNSLLSRKLCTEQPSIEVKSMLRDTDSINGLTTSILSTGEEHYLRLNDLKDTGSSTVSSPPKYILRQINERKALNTNPILNENGGGTLVGGGGLNRKKLKQSKLIASTTTSSAAINLAKQQYAQQLATTSSSLANTNANSRLQHHNASSKSATVSNFAAKMNEEFFHALNNNNITLNNHSQQIQTGNYPISNSPANLYASTFISNTPLKTQFDKINGRQNGGGGGNGSFSVGSGGSGGVSGGLVNSASSFLANSNNNSIISRQKK
jgi:hypothetical protein